MASILKIFSCVYSRMKINHLSAGDSPDRLLFSISRLYKLVLLDDSYFFGT
ncbi:MAG: hypothetical protein J0H74_14430 [Chitinophagaceae bacterium]|nr:hypothetical protein [Chitinophagaceae bacterium]